MPSQYSIAPDFRSNYVSVVLATVLAAVVFYVYWPLTQGGPAPVESMIGLAHGQQGSLLNPFDIPAAEGPRWVTYYSFVLQNRIFGAEAFPHYVVNIALLSAAAVAIFAFASAVTHNPLVGFVAAVTWLLNENLFNTVEWLLGRQNMFLILFGVGALNLVWFRGSRFTWLDMFALATLLFLASCSKEYGLAFFPAAIAIAWFHRPRSFWKVSAAAVFAFLLFLALRQMLADPYLANGGWLACDTMGYFSTAQHKCTRMSLDTGNIAQMTYNTLVSLIGLLSPEILANVFVSPVQSSTGQLQLAEMRIRDWALSITLVSAIATGIAARAPGRAIWVSLILANVVLGAPFYRGRHLLAGQIGSAVLVSYGIWTWAMIATRFIDKRAVMLGSAAGFLLSALLFLGPHANRINSMAAGATAKLEPEYYCNEARKTEEWLNRHHPGFDTATIDAVIAANELKACG